MNKSIAAISWPTNASEAVRLFLSYMIKVIEQLGISFGLSTHDPMVAVKELLAGKLSEDDRDSNLTYWWSVVDDRGVRNFESKDVLIARLAVCLLSPNQEKTLDLGEQLSWFLEVLGMLGADVEIAIDIMEQHFMFGKSGSDSN